MSTSIRQDKIRQEGSCLIWTGAKTKAGYGVKMTPRSEGKRKALMLHRIAYCEAKGQIPDGLFVLHSCDRPACVNPDHLRVGTHQENMDDKVLRRRQHRPAMEENGRRRLSCDVVKKIRDQVGDRPFTKGERKAFAEQYGVTGQTIYYAAKRKTWAPL